MLSLPDWQTPVLIVPPGPPPMPGGVGTTWGEAVAVCHPQYRALCLVPALCLLSQHNYSESPLTCQQGPVATKPQGHPVPPMEKTRARGLGKTLALWNAPFCGRKPPPDHRPALSWPPAPAWVHLCSACPGSSNGAEAGPRGSRAPRWQSQPWPTPSTLTGAFKHRVRPYFVVHTQRPWCTSQDL